MEFFKRNPVISIVVLVLVAVLLIGGISRLASIAATPFSFSQGTVDVDGKFAESTASVITMNAMACEGLTVTTDFKFDGTYRIVFYDEKGEYVASTAELNGNYEVTADDIAEGGPFAGATQCRLILIPKNDTKITDSEVIKYAAALTISYAE